jgi:RHS repeat-associated protein
MAWEPFAQWHGSQRLIPITDKTGAVREVLDARGSVLWRCTLDTYGQVLTESGSPASPFRFRGQQWDASNGLHYNFARTYDPRLGDYLSPDPIGIVGGSNFYAYPRNPLVWDDPFGLTCNAHKAEAAMDKHFTDPPPKGKGMIKLKNPSSPKPKPLKANGIDAVYMDPSGGPPKYVIAEAKSGSATLIWTKDGKVQQMSDNWINGKPGGRGDNRLDKAVGSTQATDIRNSASTPGEVSKVVYSKPDPNKPGSVTQSGDFSNSKRQSF